MSHFFFEKLSIPEVVLCRPRKFSDARGYFMEVYREADFAGGGVPCRFIQDNLAVSLQKGTVRGLHYQLPPERQAKLVRVVRGAIFDVAVDLRLGSPTYGQWCGVTLTSNEGTSLFVPRGFAHGYCTLEDNTHVGYKVDRYYSAEHDVGIAWNDPDVGVEWPIAAGREILSANDSKLPLLRDIPAPFYYAKED